MRRRTASSITHTCGSVRESVVHCHAHCGGNMKGNRSAPSATVVPILVYEDVGQAIEFLCTAFGFSERLRMERAGVIGHAQLAIAEGAIMIGREGGPFRAP